MADKEKKKKESILDLSKYIDKTIRVKFQGGREASGILKGFDPLLNLVLDGTIEYMRGEWGSGQGGQRDEEGSGVRGQQGKGGGHGAACWLFLSETHKTSL
uniref:LSM7 homolog, U6 small nuclear RNA and mRNA degradation associated n=1 Tax=Piliocolobus tephrosceles TaxID=591936 RepID=A0A8C9LU97_9PRIM